MEISANGQGILKEKEGKEGVNNSSNLIYQTEGSYKCYKEMCLGAFS